MKNHPPHLYENTPIRISPRLNSEISKEVYFKMECHQPTRSFKIRGMDHLVREQTALGIDRFIASSGGNAGYSLAYCTKRYGAFLKVFVPVTTPSDMVKRIQSEGVQVEIVGESWDEAHAAASDYAIATHSYYVSPFDDPLLWSGHSTLVHECVDHIHQPDLIVLSVGGGGLMCGVLHGLRNSPWAETPVLAMETHGAASLAAALKAEKVVDFGPITSDARSLGARRVALTALNWAMEEKVKTAAVTDEEAWDACRKFADDFQVLVEPACGASLATVYNRVDLLGSANRILVIACGGAGVTMGAFP
jgi:L-serine/L-threonine ammonia-lyase